MREAVRSQVWLSVHWAAKYIKSRLKNHLRKQTLRSSFCFCDRFFFSFSICVIYERRKTAKRSWNEFKCWLKCINIFNWNCRVKKNLRKNSFPKNPRKIFSLQEREKKNQKWQRQSVPVRRSYKVRKCKLAPNDEWKVATVRGDQELDANKWRKIYVISLERRRGKWWKMLCGEENCITKSSKRVKS